MVDEKVEFGRPKKVRVGFTSVSEEQENFQDVSPTTPMPVTLNASAFGEPLVAELSPVINVAFIYGLNTLLVGEVNTGSGAASHSGSLAKVDTTAVTSSSSKLESVRRIVYRPGQGNVARFTAKFTTGVAGSEQKIGIGCGVDGLFFGFNGASFGILHRNDSVDEWIAQTSWNVDPADGTKTLEVLDPTKGNVFQITYQWLGFGVLSFAIEDPTTGKFVVVHRVIYGNRNIVPSMTNPSFPIMMEVENTTNNTSIAIESASWGGFIVGRDKLIGLHFSTGNTKLAVTTTLTNILTIRNLASFQGKVNQVPGWMHIMNVASDGNKPVEFSLIHQATLGGSPSYADVDTAHSVMEVDIAGTTITGGHLIYSGFLGKSEGVDIDLDSFLAYLAPGETFTLAARATQTTSDISASLNWLEDH